MKYHLTHRGFVISFGWSNFRITISIIYFLWKSFAAYFNYAAITTYRSM